ncbi:MAG: hypothetical protein ABSG13_24290 [Bryobacteraceae bacterium]|jgi:hypothetical protein
MKKTLLLIPFVFGLGSAAWASTCTSDTLAVYDTPGFSCTLGDLTFDDFAYIPAASGGAVAPPDAGVTVTPVTTGPTGFTTDTGLLFTAAWLASSGQTVDSSISYDVSTSNPGGITDLALVIVGGSLGTGSASVAETAAIPPAPPSEFLDTAFSSGFNSATDAVTFPPAGSLSLTKDIALVGGTGGSAHVSDVYNLFSQGTNSTVPEPSLVILCGGLLVLLPVARRKFVH